MTVHDSATEVPTAGYRSVPHVPDFPALEREVLAFWKEQRVFQTLRKRNENGPRWSFLDGPITANNPMGVHHAWGRSLKDMYQRYHAMTGRHLRYQNGFDCQGLWVEVEVEKSLGLASKREIHHYGLANFVRACKERVLTYAAQQTRQSIRLGYWCDWDDPQKLLSLRDALAAGDQPVKVQTAAGDSETARASEIIRQLGSTRLGGSYFTFSDENNYTIWAFLKKCHVEGYLYRGHDVMPWCGRCGTGLSQMEVAEGRHIVHHVSVFVRFPLKGKERTALLVWTTTPWTLTSDVAVAVNPAMRYLRVKHGDWTYFVGRDNFENPRLRDLTVEGKNEVHKLPSIRSILLRTGEVEVLGEIAGSELSGLRYHGPFDDLSAQQMPGGLSPYGVTGGGASAADAHQVIEWEKVTGNEGTGLVHIAPGCGPEDQELGHRYGLPVLAPIDESGAFLDGFGPFSGRKVSEAGDDVLKALKDAGFLVASERYPHVYPSCWRCKEDLVFRPVDEWFIRMDWRDRIQKVVPTVRWIPSDGEAREQDWLRNMGDWMISKKRFWGLALPIWVCGECGHFSVIGSREELRAKAVDGWDVFDGHSPHRPYIDAVRLACERCGGMAARVEDVGNPWLDAGIVPFSTLGYNSDHTEWQKWFPADLVLESFPGQFRNWFYSMLATSAMVDGRAPFRNLLGHGLVRDARGDEMHKSRGNSIPFDEAAEVLGAEVMRYIYAKQKTSQHLSFPDLHPTEKGGATADSEARRKLLTFWNCYSFFVTYATADGWKPEKSALPTGNDLDRWILSRLQRFVAGAHRAFGNFEHFKLTESFEAFTEELSNWYLRRSRRRFWNSEPEAYQTLYTVLFTVIRVMAPILPFLTEHIYQNLVRTTDFEAPESIHLTPYPEADQTLVNEELEERFEAVVRVRNLALHLRTRSKVRVRQPLEILHVRPASRREREILDFPANAEHILDEVNVKRLFLTEDESTLVSIRLTPDVKKIAQRAGRHLKQVREAVQHMEFRDLLAGEGCSVLVDGGKIDVARGEIVISSSGPEHLTCVWDGNTFVALDTTLTPELELEGLAREFKRVLQDHRRALGLRVSDRIRIRYTGTGRIASAIGKHQAYLQAELLADCLEAGRPDCASRLVVDGETIDVAIEKA